MILKSTAMQWYHGPTLMAHLETVPVGETNDCEALPPAGAMGQPSRPDFRGFCGTIAAGTIRKGDAVKVIPSGRTSRVAQIVTFDGDLNNAVAGQSVTVTLDDEVDVSRGDVLCAANDPVSASDQFEARILWMGDEPMLPGRPYLIKIGTQHRQRRARESEIQGQCQHARACRGQDLDAERDRHLQSRSRRARRLLAL